MANTALRLRFISRVMVATLVVLVGTIIVVRDYVLRAQAPSATTTTTTAASPSHYDLGGVAAPDFTLTDQSGAALSLASLRGRPVVLTFLYTHCPDECPLTAEKLHSAVVALGDRASQIAWLAVSVDPVGDTPADAKAFVGQHHLDGFMRYLLGSETSLHPVWDAYHIAVAPSGDATSQVGTVSHVVGVYVIDGQGHERTLYDNTFSPAYVVAELRGLLGR
jgi:protein SCO1/2